jgi:Ig-like domain from next to BRCA1 gene
MNKKTNFIFLTLFCMAIILIGCKSKATASPTTNPDLIYTAAAQTADVRLTQIFQSTPSATPVTPTPTFNATQTAAAQTAASMLTQTVATTPTPPGTATVAPQPTGPAGEFAVFVSDVTIPDGTIIAPGAAFTKTWKLQNGGTSTWTTAYSLVFISGEQMGTVNSVKLTQSVAPGAQVDVSVNMVAPSKDGTYQGYWKMKNASGSFFNDSVYVLIKVGSGGLTPTVPGTTPSPTSTGSPGNPITSVSMAVDQGTFSGACPHTFVFTANLVLNQGATLTYEIKAGSDTPGFTFNLPSPVTATFGPGTYALPFPLIFTSSGKGWIQFHVSAPVDTLSNQSTFDLTCTP